MNLDRIIPLLLLSEGGLVKTKKFKDPIYLGDPINAVRIFNEKEVDELIILDIDQTSGENSIDYKKLKEIVSESFIPIAYGGGINSVDVAKKILEIGVEKIVINSSSEDFALISELANVFGSQSIVISLDFRKNIFGQYSFYKNKGQIKIKYSIDEFIKKIIEAGAGELMLQSIDREGTMTGYDLDFLKKVTSQFNIPVIIAGGASSIHDFKKAIIEGQASGVAAGSLFVFKGKHKAVLINYPNKIDLMNLNLKR